MDSVEHGLRISNTNVWYCSVWEAGLPSVHFIFHALSFSTKPRMHASSVAHSEGGSFTHLK